MAGVQLINPTDTLETGFRSKYNQTANEIIVDYAWIAPAGTQQFATGDILQLKKFGGGFVNIQLSQYYVNKATLATQLGALTGIPYKGNWNAAAYDSIVLVDYAGALWRSTGATATTDIPGVSVKWTSILSPNLYPWDSTRQYFTNNTVRYQIGDTWYQFFSLTDNNATTPSLTPGTAPWTAANASWMGGWVTGSYYTVGQAVSDAGNIYRKKTNASAGAADIQPSSDTGNSFWDLVGVDRGLYNSGTSYNLNDAVYNGTNDVYKSNVNSNTASLNSLSNNQWGVIGAKTQSGGAQKISLPSSAYPDSVPYADSDRVTVNIGDSLAPIIGAYEVNARLIVNGAQYDVPPSFTYGTGGRVTSIFFEVGGISSGFKINFEA